MLYCYNAIKSFSTKTRVSYVIKASRSTKTTNMHHCNFALEFTSQSPTSVEHKFRTCPKIWHWQVEYYMLVEYDAKLALEQLGLYHILEMAQKWDIKYSKARLGP